VQKSRGEIMASAVDNYLGDGLVCEKYFPESAKKHVGSS
jgi:putative endopeptidase